MEKVRQSLVIVVLGLTLISLLATGYQTFIVNDFAIDYSEETEE